ncbi:MAG TPA: hypothetical protein V6D22_15470 [Candidatus Obscuribacterales bacterium]
MNKFAIMAFGSTMALLSSLSPAYADRVNANAMEKSHWYSAPREIQIINEEPVVRDFREAPTAPRSIDLPNGPSGNSGLVNGMHVGGGPGYRTPYSSNPVGLPKADFGHASSNIPASLMSPRKGLPNGTSARQMSAPISAPKFAKSPAAPSPVHTAAPVRPAAPVSVMTYAPSGGNYGNSVGSGGGTYTKTGVRGSLLSKVK